MESKDFSFKNKCLQILSIPLIQQSTSQAIDQNYVKVRSRNTKKCQECETYISQTEYYKYEKNYNFSKNDNKNNYVCCQNCYDDDSIYKHRRVSKHFLKKVSFGIHTLGNYYINKKTGKIIDFVPYKNIPINPNLHQLSQNE